MTIPESAGVINESAVVPRGPEPAQILMALVGWPGEDEVVELGTADNDGASLLRCTCLTGAQPGDEPKPGEASGYRVSVRVPGPLYHVPPKGTEVILAFPAGVGLAPAAGVMLGTLSRTPDHQFSETALKIDAGTERDLILKGRSVIITRHNASGTGAEDFISVSPDGGIQALDSEGNGFLVKDGAVTMFAQSGGKAVSIVRVTADSVELAQKPSDNKTTLLKITGDVISLLGKTFRALTGNIALGVAAAQPVMLGTSVPSTAVFSQ